MIEILLFKEQFQVGVNALIQKVAKEFKSPISLSNANLKAQTFDNFWVAIYKDEVIGTIAILKIGNKYGVLKSMFVKQEFRGDKRGVAKLLLQNVLNWCRKEQLGQLLLGTMVQFKAAQKFYQKNGFVKIEKLALPKDFPYNPLDNVFFYYNLNKPNFQYTTGSINDLDQIMQLANLSWLEYKQTLKQKHWNQLQKLLQNPNTYTELLDISQCFLCKTKAGKLIGMAFLVPSGNPTKIYKENWAYIRFVSVDPDYAGQKIGQTLTNNCITQASLNNESIVALHTSEMMQKAIRIYEKLGFKIFHEIDQSLGKRYWLYTLNLD